MRDSVRNRPRFRTYQFIFANTFLHEVGGHLFITFLSPSPSGFYRAVTPSSITADVPGYSNGFFGESGRRLECILFGGNLECYRDFDQDDQQVGLAEKGCYLYSKLTLA